ncbi:P-loop containing nucleoside triphosphate hydrolase protein [Flammula alnicola]|nr:P-loop containing nucleoside triphosphate hydrolase protein [Flammula alnicola]
MTFFFDKRPNELFVKLANPTPLTYVIVTALSLEAYLQASGDASPLDDWLFSDQAILRQGDIYRLDMLEPVLQGYATLGETKIILLSSQNNPPSIDTVESISDEQDAIEIDECFLGSSVLNHSGPSHLRQNHDAQSTQSSKYSEDSSTGYISKTLVSPCNLLEDPCTLYLRAADLGKIGILSGDWAIAGVKPSNSRLVRIVANDDVVDLPGFVAGSPLLIHNTFPDEAEAYSFQPPSIHIRPSPFGSFNPVIPIARSITIARVASPISTNRQYQHLFINSLKAYFDSNKRLMKQGDILAISIDTDFSRLVYDQDNKQDGASNGFDEDVGGSRYPNYDPRSNEVVFFKVTNIEYDVMSRSDSSVQDSYTGSTLGELGCWVDTSITRMIQTGVEYSRVPNTKNVDEVLSQRFGGYQRLRETGNTEISHLLGPQSPFSKILALTSAALSQRAMDYDLQLSFLLKGGRSVGKFTIASWVAHQLGLHLFEVNCYDILGETDVKTEAILQVRLEQARGCTPCLLVLRHLEALSQTTQAAEPGKEPSIINVLRESLDNMQSSWKLTGYPVIVLGTTSESGRVPPSLLSCFKQEVAFEAPNEGERLEIIDCLLADQKIAPDVSLQSLATQTAALVAGDLRDLVARAKTASVERATKTIALASQGFIFGKHWSPKIPTVSWDDVGGLAHVKSDILDTIQLPLDHPELFADGLKKRSGILLYGPPGTGKTLIAKAVATSCSLNFFSVKGPELLNMYIGESEANVRRVFQRARDAKPCVIFFDELDSVAPKRGNHGDSGGVMDRIVSQLLAELDGMSAGKEGADVFVIGATNRPDLLDPALLRPGRFDRLLYLGVSDTHEAQLNILDALTRKFRLDPDLDLRSIAEKCPFNYTGADFYALCSDAMLNAMSRKAESIEEKILALNSQPSGHGHLIPSHRNTTWQSLHHQRTSRSTQAEMEHYGEVQRRFSQNKIEEE